MKLSWMILVAALLVACNSPAPTSPAPTGHERLSAREILKKPLHGNLKDAHFTVSNSANSNDFNVSGEGDIVVSPKPASRVQVTTLTTSSFSGPSRTIEASVSGPDGLFTRTGDDPKWKRTAGSGPVGRYAAWFAAANPQLAGEDVINGSRSWHLLADYGSLDLDLWIRQSDGFPAREQFGTTIYDYQRFNTGVKVAAPAASEVELEPNQVDVRAGETAQPSAGRPSAQEILNKPLTATSLVDTRFKSSSTNAYGDQSLSEGDFVFRPRPAFGFQSQTTQAPQFTTTHSEILAEAALFTRNDQQRKWRKLDRRGRPAAFAPWYAATNPSYVGEETVNGSKCWRVRADYGEQSLDAWIRQSDGYPIRSRIGTNTVDYVRFNTGARVSAPAPGEVRPPPMNVTIKVGETAHLYAVDVTSTSVKPDFQYGRDFTPNPGQHFYGVQLLFKATGEDVVRILDTQWELADSSGKRFTRTNFSTVDDTQPLSSAGQKLDDTLAFNVPNGSNPATFKARLTEDTLTVNLP